MNKIGYFTRNIFESIADTGEKFLDLSGFRGTPVQELMDLCNDLISHKGIVSGIALAREVVTRYKALNDNERLAFFQELTLVIESEISNIKMVAEDFVHHPDEESLQELYKSLRTKYRKLFNRMNMAPNGTEVIVDLRRDLLRLLPEHPELKAIDNELRRIFTTWFNPGFLVLKRIDWNSEASVLEKIIRYETVHNIGSWKDLKQRLVENRRCFAYFHPSLGDEPLIFVEVALTKGIANSVQTILHNEKEEKNRDTAIFYSINNCQRGLKGIPLGNFLIKMVVTEIAKELPSIKYFSSLSPVTGFSDWLKTAINSGEDKLFGEDINTLKLALQPDWYPDPKIRKQVKNPLMKVCANYLVNQKKNGKPVNSVARFHFSNGAELYRINWMGNSSKHGMADSFGLMVNYLYDLRHIEINHERYTGKGELAISRNIKKLLS